MAKNTNKSAAPKAAAVQTTVKVNDKIAKAIEIIKEHQSHVKVAYFNVAGEYHFHKRPGFKAVPIQDEEEDIDLEVEAETDTELDETPVGAGGAKLEF
jgi:hypothetical protein